MMKLTVALLLLAQIIPAYGGAIKYRDDRGNTTGSSTRDSQGTRRYYDAGGRSTGSCSTDSQHTTTCYDAGGNVTGRSSR